MATTIRDYLSKVQRNSRSYTPVPQVPAPEEPVPIAPRHDSTVGSKAKKLLKKLTVEKIWLPDPSLTNYEKRPESPFNPNDEH